MIEFFLTWANAVWLIIIEASPWLIFGFFLAGIIKVFISPDLVAKHLKKRGIASVIKASAFGVPLPLCSCSVIPVAVSLKKSGASKGAVGSFLVSTPEIGVDSFMLSYGILGPFIAILRMIIAFISAFTVGVLIDTFADKSEKEEIVTEEKSCCHAKKAEVACCDGEKENNKQKINRTLRYAFVELIDDISVSLTIGFLAAGLISILVPADFSLGQNFSFIQQLLIVLLISIPLYVCASSSTPIAATLLAKGMGIGPVIVFLMLGPATNMATVLVVLQQLGKKAFVFYLSGISLVAIMAAVLLDKFFLIEKDKILHVAESHAHQASSSIFAYLVLFLIVQSLSIKLVLKFNLSNQRKSCCSKS